MEGRNRNKVRKCPVMPNEYWGPYRFAARPFYTHMLGHVHEFM